MDLTNEIKSNSLVFAGPFLGEFGWEISHWIPHVRWLRKHYRGKHLIAASYPDRQALYKDIINEFWTLPEWFVNKKYDCDCFESLCEPEEYGKLISYFHNKCINGSFANIIETRTPRGFNYILKNTDQMIFDKLNPSQEANERCQVMIKAHGETSGNKNRPCVIIFAREMQRTMFLDVQDNCRRYVSDLPYGLPSRNWPRSYWQDLFNMLYVKYNNQVTFAIGGTKENNCLIDLSGDRAINITEENDLDLTIAFLNNSLCCICSQSGPMHLSLHCKCPTFIYGHEEYRNAVQDNPLRTEVVHFTTEIDKYNDPPELLFKDISVMLDDLLKRKQEINLTGIKNNEKKQTHRLRIGMVGVFDILGSTNISFAKAFSGFGHEVEVFNYRTVAKEIGYSAMNKEIIKFASDFDLIIFCKGNGISPETIKACSNKTTTCWYMMDALEHLKALPIYYDMARMADFNIVTTKELYDDLRKKGIYNVRHIIQGISTEEFYPTEFAIEYDIVFIGQRTAKRDYIINLLRSKGYKIKVFGPGYDKAVTGKEFNNACCKAFICLGINNTSASSDAFSDRIIRYMATKSCVLTEYTKGLEKYFKNFKHLVWFKNTAELIANIDTLLDNEMLRKTIASAGYKKVKKEHTWEKVVEQILTIYKGDEL